MSGGGLLSRIRDRWAALLAVFALALMAPTASAQLEALPSWAVVEFADRSPDQSLSVGKMASMAISDELARGGRVEVLPLDQVSRQAADLGYQPPITKAGDLQRLGQALQAQTIISGEVVNWRVVPKDNGRMAQVLMRIIVWDAAAGLAVNGAAVGADSDVVSGEITNEQLVKNALAQGAFEAIQQINTRTLANATILNTLNNRALINRGARAGFTKDQRVIVTRGKSQVAEGIVREVDPDSSFIETTRSYRGIQPGDKVRAVFDVPTLKDKWSRGGQAQVVKPKGKGSNSSVVSLVLVLLVLGFLLLGGRGSNQNAVGGVTAEAVVLPNDVPAVRVSWVRDAFQRGTNSGPLFYQVWRDGNAVPVSVVQASQSSAIHDRDGAFTGNVWYDFGGIIGGDTCRFDGLPGATLGPQGALPGTPYRFSVEVVYRVSELDLPDGSTGGTGGTTGGVTGGGTGGGTGGTTGGTTGGVSGGGTGGGTGGTGGTTGGGNDDGFCFFVSSRVAARGQATPLTRAALQDPADRQVITQPVSFSFLSVRGPVRSIPIEYLVQFSDRRDFPAGRTFASEPFVDFERQQDQIVASPTIDTSTIFPTANVIYWRVGAKNPDDNPGPVADRSGLRYIFSSTRSFLRSSGGGKPNTVPASKR